MPPDSTPSPSGTPGPLGPLALSLSGGGYRAATFHLGSLRFLDTVGLLPDVVGLSTVSGGTLVGLAWVLSQLEGKAFPEFYEGYSAYLKRTNVIGEALTGLTSHRDHGSHEWASLIGEAAKVYARPDCLGDHHFGEVLDASRLQLQEAIFNTTEFHRGLDFRFRRSNRPATILGNAYAPLPRSVARHVRLADVAAASSCFPGGFEPLVFPQQFHWPQEFPLSAALAELGPGFQGGLPLMDGGVYDNQGIDALLLAFQGSPNPPTLIISDVSTKVPEMYNVPENPTKRGWITLEGIRAMAWGLFFLTLTSAVVLAWNAFQTVRSGTWGFQDVFLYGIPGLLSTAVATALIWTHRRLDDASVMLRKQLDLTLWPSIRKLTVPELTQMVVLRVTSVLALTTKVFMKRVRGLVYGQLYSDPRFKDRRMSNLIDTLTVDRPLFARHPWLRPQPQLVALATRACQMPTTLWFTEEAQFITLETAGEATICFVLLRHIIEHRAGQYETEGLPLHNLFLRLRKEWEVFNPASAPQEAQRSVAA
ncbi:patatin-like phospholipase family protein [Corallococcus terminator]|uniref:Patatin-like phospholipase family protein n=1 Tax=Corallococcus terminator TaxID=2316733 RepID=A0A3A8IPF4_9BACT|nr:patatin-like phospholipase family protein [Corallococcus terminator]RKG81720.1 patatin-like phospholipase family protein [Corallococcus terminator]